MCTTEQIQSGVFSVQMVDFETENGKVYPEGRKNGGQPVQETVTDERASNREYKLPPKPPRHFSTLLAEVREGWEPVRAEGTNRGFEIFEI